MIIKCPIYWITVQLIVKSVCIAGYCEDKWICQWDAQIVSFVIFPSYMAFDRLHTAFYANSFTLASFYVCLWEDVSKNVGIFLTFLITVGAVPSCGLYWLGILNFPASTTWSAQPSCRFFLLCSCSFSLSDSPACSPCVPWFASWGEISTFQLSARIWRWHMGPSMDDAFCFLPLSLLP